MRVIENRKRATVSLETPNRLLIVDDEEPFRKLIERNLRRAGASVTGVGSGEDALLLLTREEFDVCVLDLTMPDLGGEETFAALRELGAEVPIILSSGYSEREVRAGFEGMGPSEFLHKPFTTGTLLDVLRRVLDTAD